VVYEKIEIRYRQPLHYEEFLPLEEQEWYKVYLALKAELNKIELLVRPTLPDSLKDKPLDEVIEILKKQEGRQEGRIEIENILKSPESQKRREIQKFIVEFIKEKGGEASLEDILEHSKDKYEKEEIMETLKRMKRAGIIYEPKLTLYKLTEGF